MIAPQRKLGGYARVAIINALKDIASDRGTGVYNLNNILDAIDILEQIKKDAEAHEKKN